jgi:7-cyano-7-deazaguanine synthase
VNKNNSNLIRKAVCLFSGGLDSTTVLYYVIREGFTPLALTVDYGQIHGREVAAAKKIAKQLNIEHKIVKFDLPWGGSALLDSSIPMPENRSVKEMPSQIPVTYVPARNTILLSLATSFAETSGASHIFIGANALDYSGYPDCRPEYLEAFRKVVQLGTKAGVEGKSISVAAPLLKLTKADIVKLGSGLGVPFELTWSCYQGGEYPCQKCDACLLREKGFEEAGLTDPAQNLCASKN